MLYLYSNCIELFHYTRLFINCEQYFHNKNINVIYYLFIISYLEILENNLAPSPSLHKIYHIDIISKYSYLRFFFHFFIPAKCHFVFNYSYNFLPHIRYFLLKIIDNDFFSLLLTIHFSFFI